MEPNRKNNFAAYIDLGLEFAVAVALGVGLGYYADTRLHTLPLFLVLGLLLGSTSGFLNIYRTVFPNTTKKSKEDNSKASDEN